MQNSPVKHVRLFVNGNFRYYTLLKNFLWANLLKYFLNISASVCLHLSRGHAHRAWCEQQRTCHSRELEACRPRSLPTVQWCLWLGERWQGPGVGPLGSAGPSFHPWGWFRGGRSPGLHPSPSCCTIEEHEAEPRTGEGADRMSRAARARVCVGALGEAESVRRTLGVRGSGAVPAVSCRRGSGRRPPLRWLPSTSPRSLYS